MGVNESRHVTNIFEATEWRVRGQRALESCCYEEARQAYVHALALEPYSVDVLRGLGFALFQLKQLAQSLEMLERALRIDPSDLLSRLLMGRLCLRLQQPAGAIEHFSVILQRIGNSASARSGLIDAHLALGQLPQAEALCGEILNAEPHAEVGQLAAARLATLKRDDEKALLHFETLVQSRPHNVVHRYNRGLCLLRMGRFDEGWCDYEFRFAAGAVHLRLPPTPRWDGRRVGSLLVLAEQGLGDTILFSRFLRDAASRVDRLTLVCADSLVGLVGRSLDASCVSGESATWPPHDAHVPLMSLPFVLGLGAAAVESCPAYLTVDAARRERWASLMAPRTDRRLRVGVVHATSAAHSTEENPWTRRSCPPEDLLPIVQVEGIESYNLNLGRAGAVASAALPGLQELPAPLEDFDDTAAVVSLLDAVISVDTACAHVAGATGTCSFILLPPAPDWKWQTHGSTPPWYQSTRLIHMDSAGQWPGAVASLVRRLTARID
ncbi:MAG TPA: tetratricopeptide repeat-containing glycosyltransferase family protein [Burkholderiaceae bacterium]|nr:tetratricopeptide repeat-containing glycosyltransferase family protein [Burkholderiaceae bacterium]